MKIKNDVISFDGVMAKELADQYGTPLFVYEEQKIRENFRRAFNAFKKYYDNFRFFYAIKGNSNPAIAHILKQEGAGIDTAAVNEILLAKSIGLSGEDIMFSGNYLSDEDLKEAFDFGVIINLDDISLLPRLLKFGVPSILSFRVNPGYGKSNVGYFNVTAGPDAKFGIHPDQVMKAYKMAKEAGIKRLGVHMMTGTCLTDAEYFPYVTGLLMDIISNVSRQLKIDFEFVNIGGGLGIPYRPDEKELDIKKTAWLTVEMFKNKIKEYSLKSPQLMMEPARYFVGNAGYLIGRVHAIKEGYKKIVGTDIGMNVLPRPALYNAYHHVYVDGKESKPREKIDVCGQICENTDIWYKNQNLPSLAVGDLIVVENVGAYCFGMSYQYNGQLKAAEVLVNQGQSELIRERESFEDTIRGVKIPKRLLK